MAIGTSEFGEWRPWHPQEVARFFSALTVPWWIAGGWALDLFLGGLTRAHEDIDVQFVRRDAQAIQAVFQGWDIQEAGHPTTRPGESPFRQWASGAPISPGIHDIWCRPTPDAAWALQLMVADTTGDEWVFRRDKRISRPLDAIGCRTTDGLPYLAPDIQLLYKAKSLRPKDAADFAQVLPSLDGERRQWLAHALVLAHPGHPWIAHLTAQ